MREATWRLRVYQCAAAVLCMELLSAEINFFARFEGLDWMLGNVGSPLHVAGWPKATLFGVGIVGDSWRSGGAKSQEQFKTTATSVFTQLGCRAGRDGRS